MRRMILRFWIWLLYPGNKRKIFTYTSLCLRIVNNVKTASSEGSIAFGTISAMNKEEAIGWVHENVAKPEGEGWSPPQIRVCEVDRDTLAWAWAELNKQ